MEQARAREFVDYFGRWAFFTMFLALITGPSLFGYSLFFAISSAFCLWKAISFSRAAGAPLTLWARIALLACPLVLIWIISESGIATHVG
ncbi:MAG: hypothetical protein M3285_03435 [Actinomycetota bacterium]|nr:hypothetical protein [Actinomycetota bacterium]